MNTIQTFFESYGMWSLISLMVVKLVVGVAVAVQKGEFKWYYLANFLKTDALQVAVLMVIAIFLHQDVLTATLGAVLATSFTAGIVKNLAHMFPEVADSVWSSLREPARFRLGNPRSTQS